MSEVRDGEIVFTGMDRVVFGRPAAEAVVQMAERLGAKRVFLLTSRTLNRETDVVRRIAAALGPRSAGVHDEMPAHTPRDAVSPAPTRRARPAATCWSAVWRRLDDRRRQGGHHLPRVTTSHEPDGLEPFRTVVDEITGKRSLP